MGIIEAPGRRRIAPAGVLVLVAALSAGPTLALPDTELVFGVDVPTALPGGTFLPNQLTRCLVASGADACSLAFDGGIHGLGPAVHVDAVTLVATGFVFSTDAPFTAASVTYAPADLVLYTATTGNYSTFLSATAIGLPPTANVDALAIDPTGYPIVSFDAPVTVGADTFGPADLVRIKGTAFQLWFSATAASFPAAANVVGVELLPSGDIFFGFDAPITLSATSFLPGDVVRDSGGAFSLHFRESAFPRGSLMTDFAFPRPPGPVPDGAAVAGTPLRLTRAGSKIEATFGVTCAAAGIEDAIYEGSMGAFYSHSPLVCATGSLDVTFVPGAGDRYYLAVAHNGMFEGSYGLDSAGSEIPAGASRCLGESSIESCP